MGLNDQISQVAEGDAVVVNADGLGGLGGRHGQALLMALWGAKLEGLGNEGANL